VDARGQKEACVRRGRHLRHRANIRLNRPSVQAMPPYVKLLCPLLAQATVHTLTIEGFYSLHRLLADEKSAAKFHYIKTVSGKVVAHSIAFRVVSIYWQGTTPSP